MKTPKGEMTVETSLAERSVHALLGADENFPEFLGDELFGFGIALIALQRGHKVARASWQNPGKYVFLVLSSEFSSSRWRHHEINEESFPGHSVAVKPFLCWKNDKGDLVPWTPSQDAILARDWFIGESGKYPQAEYPKKSPIGYKVTIEGPEATLQGVQQAEVDLLDSLTKAADAWVDRNNLSCEVSINSTRKSGKAKKPWKARER